MLEKGNQFQIIAQWPYGDNVLKNKYGIDLFEKVPVELRLRDAFKKAQVETLKFLSE
jgi:hypothetical protein